MKVKKGLKGKQKGKQKQVVQKTRKQLRKEKREQKKVNRAQYHSSKKNQPGKYVLKPKDSDNEEDFSNKSPQKNKKEKKVKNFEDKLKKELQREKREKAKLAKGQLQNRRNQLLEDNANEDKVIKQLEKQLKLNKRKGKSIPRSFREDGLDDLLGFCDSSTRKMDVETEKQLLNVDAGSDFEEDFALVTKGEKKERSKDLSDDDSMGDSLLGDEDDLEDEAGDLEMENGSGDGFEDDFEDSEAESEPPVKRNAVEKQKSKPTTLPRQAEISDDDFEQDFEDFEDSEAESEPPAKRKAVDKQKNKPTIQPRPTEASGDDSEDDDGDFDDEDGEDDDDSNPKSEEKQNDGTWEDIYGRKRDKDGNILDNKSGKYIPPAARLQQLEKAAENSEKIQKLRKQLKGLINRLAEHNMHSLSNQIEELYMSNSRNSMNDIISKLMMESIVAPVKTPDRLIAEHMMLIAILHANVGTEVGAHFLLTLIRRFDEMIKTPQEVENKELDNLVLMISHLYNFKVFGSKLLYEILNKLSEKFSEKEIELILLILKTVGFLLRKDDALALKELILNLQQRATASDKSANSSRVQYMLDVLLAIKNNNMNKIPQYDPEHVEHLKKCLKSFLRKGNTVTQFNISLDDLLKVDERGKWWIVGSAWTGNINNSESSKKSFDSSATQFSQKILDLARKQRMNTDIRRNIFCILMTAEDYMDAFEKILHLGLKDQQEREIIAIIIHCCVQERTFNPYYAVLAQKFCDYERKNQMTLQYTLWDRLKALEDYNSTQLLNFSKFLTHLIIEKGLSLSALKIIDFGELDKLTMRLLRQTMLGILLHENSEACIEAFERISLAPQLQTLRDGLRLFINHFLLKNIDSKSLPENQVETLKERAKFVDRILLSRASKVAF